MTKPTITTLAVASVTCASLLVMLGYAYITVRAQHNEAVVLRTTLAEQIAKQNTARAIAATIEFTAAERETLASYFLTESDTVAFIASIETLAARLAVALETTALEIQSPKDKPRQLKVAFAVTGDRTRVEAFMQALEVLPYHSVIPTMQLARSEGAIWRGSVELLITLQP